LIGRDALGDVGHDLVWRGLPLEDDECSGHLAGLLVWAGDDGGVRDGGMGEQHGLQLGRRHLVGVVLDQLLDALSTNASKRR